VNDVAPDAKRELLLRLLRERAAKAAAPQQKGPPPLERVPRTDAMELSFGQERAWMLEQLRPDSYDNILVRFALHGRLETESLRRSIEAIVERHEILRATFPVVDGRPVQRISPSGRWHLPLLDLSGLSASSRAVEERRVIVEAGRKHFDLATGPLVTSLLVRVGEDDHFLLLCMHHIVSDGWSVDLLCREVAAWYGSFVSGTPVGLPALPIQYADYACWQRRCLAGASLTGQREYWKRKLAGPLPALELPFDRPPSTSKSFEGAVRKFALEPSLQAALRDFSRREGVTLYTTLLTALKILLFRYSAQEDVVVGTFVAGRNRIEVERLVGFFVNTLVLRSDLGGDPTVRAALHRVRDVVLEAQANADFPFEALVAELRPERDPNRSPFFDVAFNMQSFDFDAGVASAGLRIAPVSTIEQFAVTDSLTVFGYDVRKQLDVLIVYNPELFDAETIDRFGAHFVRMLRAIVSGPQQRLSDLELLSAEERASIIALGRGPRTDVPADRGYGRLFEAQAARTPHAIAVIDDDRRLTYQELDAAANAVAQLLRAEGVGAGEPVGMCAGRSATLLSWMLGALKAGAAYMPLDARYPPGRHGAMLRQSRARLVLVEDELAAKLVEATRELTADARPRLLTTAEISASREERGILRERGGLPTSVDPGSPAYVIFTSGSTGTPKGVMVSHQAMLNHFWAKIRMLDLRSADILAQTAPIGFDISVWQFLAVLLAGGTVRVLPDDAAQDPQRLFERIRACEVTVAQVVPSFLRTYLDVCAGRESSHPALERLRTLLLVGEALSPDIARRWLERWPTIPLVNGYGPSECADEATRHVVSLPPGEREFTVPIGRPIHNVSVHVLDRSSGLLPLGVAGELCIGGAGVGLGYLNDPERTAAAFIPDPFDPGARLYRTGDRARMRPDGTLEFLGRLDFQVKIRGHRIEPGEIEALLNQHAGVRQAIVHPWSSPQGDRLVAYVVPSDARRGITAESLRAHLVRTLPAYMVPDHCVMLAELPLNANGKVDRRALPAPGAAATREHVPPRTESEIAVATAWGTILNRTGIGVHDNFFELGGHSLLAAQAAARLRDALNVDVSVRALFEQQTVAQLASYLDQQRHRAAEMREEFLL
jgi:amino acid adenylation domain-containing protein